MGIQHLSSAVVSSLRTDVTVATTAQCVTELVLNSVDAGAQSIAVRIDLKNYRIQVVDNGCGLSASDLTIIGTRYMTSKCHSLSDLQTNLGHFGFRGEALCSIAEVCGTLTIVSRFRNSEETFCKVFSQGSALKVGKSHQPRPSCGTTVTVSDFLFNRPVRRARIKPALDLEEVKVHMESIALINPHVSFSLRNDRHNELILQSQRTTSIQSVFGTLFGENLSRKLIAVKEELNPFVVEGFISSKAHPLKKFQFIYVNKRLLLKTKLHKLVNSIMSRSVILKSNNVPVAPISKEINHNAFLAFSPPKRDKHAIYVLNITCPYSEYDITLDPKKTLIEFSNWDGLLNCFESLLRKFIDNVTGLNTDKEKCFDSEPPRKLKTVIDEINQLAREEARGGFISESTEQSRDLPNVIRGLPANRREIQLSPDISEGCTLSTASSQLFSSVQDGGKNGIPSTVFTEKPYSSALHTSKLMSENPITKCVPNPRENGNFTSSSDVPLKIKNIVEPMKSTFKKPQPFIAPAKGTVSFLSNPILFADDQQTREHNSHVDSTMSPPLNALANIKEIRRKKLLSNLNKFSFKTACEKPVLQKALLPSNTVLTEHETTRLKQNETQQGQPNTCELNEQELLRKKFQESKAVQTNFTPASSNTTDIQTKASLNTMAILGLPGKKLESNCTDHNFFSDSPVIENERTSLTDKHNASGLINGVSAKDHLKSTYREILSVEDMIVTGYDLRHKQSTAHVLCNSASESFTKSPNIERTSSLPQCLSGAMCPLEPHTNSLNPDVEVGSCLSDDSILNSRDVQTSQTVPLLGYFGQMCLRSTSDVASSQDLNHNETHSKETASKRKLVDYDSSPSSSQESLCNEEAVSEATSSNVMLKRKPDDRHEEIVKKICLLSENSSQVECSANESQTNSNLVSNFSSCIALAVAAEDGCDKRVFEENNIITEGNVEVSNKSSFIPEPELLKHNDAAKRDTGVLQGQGQEMPCLEKCDEEGIEWIEKMDDYGKPFYLHSKSGITTYLKPNQEDKGTTFKFNERFLFLPKGMSPIFKDKCTNEISNSPSMCQFNSDNDLSTVKWDREKCGEKSDSWPFIDQLLVEADKYSTNLCSENQVPTASIKDLSQSDIKIYANVFPYSFTKEIFSNLRVLGQLDRKFIVTVATLDGSRDVIVLFDQHAVHERIRVENLTDEYKQHDGTAVWKSAAVDPELPLNLTPIEVRIMENYKHKMERLGFSFNVVNSDTINIERVPTCLLLRENREVTGRGVSVLRQHLESLIREQVDSLLSTRGVGTEHPTIIQSVISSEACRGAVKFGHSLTIADGQAFLHNLSSCSLPFQCAHGRPALVPIVDLSMLRKKPQNRKLNLQKLKTA